MFGSSGLLKNSREKPCLSRPLSGRVRETWNLEISNLPRPVPAFTGFFSRVLGFPVTMLHTLAGSYFYTTVSVSTGKPVRRKFRPSTYISTNHTTGQFRKVLWLVKISVELAFLLDCRTKVGTTWAYVVYNWSPTQFTYNSLLNVWTQSTLQFSELSKSFHKAGNYGQSRLLFRQQILLEFLKKYNAICKLPIAKVYMVMMVQLNLR